MTGRLVDTIGTSSGPCQATGGHQGATVRGESDRTVSPTLGITRWIESAAAALCNRSTGSVQPCSASEKVPQ